MHSWHFPLGILCVCLIAVSSASTQETKLESQGTGKVDGQNPLKQAKIGDWAKYDLKMDGDLVSKLTYSIVEHDGKKANVKLAAESVARNETSMSSRTIDLASPYPVALLAGYSEEQKINYAKVRSDPETIKVADREFKATRTEYSFRQPATGLVGTATIWTANDGPFDTLLKREIVVNGLLTAKFSTVLTAFGSKDKPVPTTAVSSTPSQEPKLELTEYKSETGQFRILLPEKPVTKSTDIDALTMHHYQATFRLTIFSVSHVELPKEFEKVPAKVLFDGAEKGEVDESGGKLLSSKEITFGKYPGREFVIGKKAADKLTDRVRTVRMYLVGRVSYSITLDQGDQSVSKEMAEKYFKSFELVEKK